MVVVSQVLLAICVHFRFHLRGWRGAPVGFFFTRKEKIPRAVYDIVELLTECECFAVPLVDLIEKHGYCVDTPRVGIVEQDDAPSVSQLTLAPLEDANPYVDDSLWGVDLKVTSAEVPFENRIATDSDELVYPRTSCTPRRSEKPRTLTRKPLDDVGGAIDFGSDF